MNWIFKARLYNSGAGSEGGGTPESEELKHLGMLAENIKKMQNELGDKADGEAVSKLLAEVEEIKTALAENNLKRIDTLLESINKKNEAMWSQLAELQEKAAQSQESGKKSALSQKQLISSKAVAEFVKATFAEDGTKTHNTARLEIKAAETFGYFQTFVGGEDGTTDITAFTGRVIDPELYQRRRKTNIILDYFNISTIEAPTLLYLEKVEVGDANPVNGDPGGAAWILSGQAKPKRSFRVTTGKAETKKVAIFGTIEDKLLRDIPSFENWIREDFMDEMRETINDGLLNNDPDISPLAPLGLKTNAVLYSPTPAFTGQVADPNYIDALVAAFASMADSREEPGIAFISKDVWYAIHILKDSNARWQNSDLVYVNRLGQLFIAGVEIVPVDKEDVPNTHFLLIGREVGFKIRAYGPMVFERGLNGEDFREDKTSYRAYQEFLSYIPSHREDSVMYDTFANVFTSIGVVEV